MDTSTKLASDATLNLTCTAYVNAGGAGTGGNQMKMVTSPFSERVEKYPGLHQEELTVGISPASARCSTAYLISPWQRLG